MNDTPYLGQSTELILGQEFLTWLWFRSSTGNIFTDDNGRPFTVSLEQRIVVQGGDGEYMETASVSGLASELREARMGLSTGKKVTRALIRLERGEENWQFSLKASDLSINGLKTPKIEREDQDDMEGFFLEKIYLIEACLQLSDLLYKQFISLRFSPDWLEKEVPAIHEWILHKSE